MRPRKPRSPEEALRAMKRHRDRPFSRPNSAPRAPGETAPTRPGSLPPGSGPYRPTAAFRRLLGEAIRPRAGTSEQEAEASEPLPLPMVLRPPGLLNLLGTALGVG